MFTTHRRARAALLSGIVAASAATVLAGAAPAHAATIHVSNRADDGSPTSLRAAIDDANNSGDVTTILLEPGEPYVIDRQCQSGDPDDNHGGDLDIDNSARVVIGAEPGNGLATIEVRCDGERAIDHRGGGRLELSRVRITGGNPANGASGDQNGDRDGIDAESGGAVRSDDEVRLHQVTLDGNTTGRGGNGAPPLFNGQGGRGGNGGPGSAVRADRIIAYSSTVTGNHAGDGGHGGAGLGAGNNGGDGGTGGSGALAAFEIYVVNSYVAGNVAGNGGAAGHAVAAAGGAGGVGGSGGGVYTSALEMHRTTVADNTAGNGGEGGAGTTTGGPGGSAGRGGGVWAEVGSIERSTVHHNMTGAGGAGGTGPVPGAAGSHGVGGGLNTVPGPGVSVSASTITANAAASGANVSAPANNEIWLSIVGEGQGSPSCSGAIDSGGFNAFDDDSCGATPTDSVVAPLPLGPLGDNGGSTPTRVPLPGSELDGPFLGDICDAQGVDQRGEVRPNGTCDPGAVEVPPATASAYVPVTPQRVFDTRQPGPYAGYVEAGDTLTVQFAGVAGIPADATAVAFNLTITQSGAAGFVTAHPTGTMLPLASNLNTIRAGQDVPNFAVVPLGDGGQIDFFTDHGGHLIGDVAGYFVPTQVARAGRIVPLTPTRAFDTRQPGPLQGKVPAGGSLTVEIPDLPDEADAVVLNVTGTMADAAGYVTVYPSNVARPDTSTLNLDGPGHTAANMAIVPLADDDTITLFTDAGAHLLADVTGYVTDASADLTGAGLMVPMDPVRVFDTREGAPVAPGGVITVTTAGTVGIPGNASAVLLNVTATQTQNGGYVTGWPAGDPQPLASLLNVTQPDESRANAALLPVGDQGGLSYFSDAGTHLLADAFGYLVPESTALLVS
jgi:hypothetical protein